MTDPNRLREVHRIRATLEREGYPRLQKLLLVAITGAAGFLASYVLLRAGVTAMWLRYLIAVAIAYIVFLALLWLWIRTKADDYMDVSSLPGGGRSRGVEFSGGGGEGGGGGATGSFDIDESPMSVQPGDNSPIGDVLSSAAEAEDFAIPLVALAVLAVLALSSLWVIYSAPVFFAELVLDGILATTLYRRLRRLESKHWLETAVRRTLVPFICVAIIAALTGWGAALHSPGAHSLGEVLVHARSTP